MSVFYHNDDPLLHTSLFQSSQAPQQNVMNDAYAQMYRQQLMSEMQQPTQKDWISVLDTEMKNLDTSTVERLNNNVQFSALNTQLQTLIQTELMNLVKFKINANQEAVNNVKQQLEIMRNTAQQVKNEEKQNINELNDYLQNYSHLSFNEYKNIKSGKQNATVETNKKTKKKWQNKWYSEGTFYAKEDKNKKTKHK